MNYCILSYGFKLVSDLGEAEVKFRGDCGEVEVMGVSSGLSWDETEVKFGLS